MLRFAEVKQDPKSFKLKATIHQLGMVGEGRKATSSKGFSKTMVTPKLVLSGKLPVVTPWS